MRWIRKSLPWLFLLLPFLLIAAWQREYAFSCLSWDDWDLVNDRFPDASMKPNWEGLLAPYAGHSIPWLRASVIPGLLLGGGDPRWLVGVSLVLALCTAWLMTRLLRTTIPTASTMEYFIISLAVASPIFSQVWQWWICWINFVPFGCVVLANWLVYGRTFTWGRFIACLVLFFVAAHAHGTGGLVWLALLPAFLSFLRGQPKRTLGAAWVLYGLVGMVILRPFLMGAVAVDSANELGVMMRLGDFLQYLLALVGGSLGQGLVANSPMPSQIFGGVLCLLSLAATWLGWRILRSQPQLWTKLAPWLSVTLFGLLAAASVAAARSWLPVYQALAGRYLLSTYPVWLGLYFVIKVLSQAEQGPLLSWNWPRLALGASVTVICLQANVWLEGYRGIRLTYAEHLTGVAPLNFSQSFPDNPALSKCYPNVPMLKRTVANLQAHDLLNGYLLYQTRNLSELGKVYHLSPRRGGHLTEVATDPEGKLLIEGYAYFYEWDRPADLILLTWESPSQPKPQIFCLVTMDVRNDFYHAYERFRRPEKYSSWRVRLAPTQLPESTGTIKAWAYDHRQKHVHRLVNAVSVVDRKLVARETEVKSAGSLELDARWPEPTPSGEPTSK